MTYQNVTTEFHQFQDVFASSSREEISASEISRRLFLNFKGKQFEKPLFAALNPSQILQIDYSSSIYHTLEFKSETALTEEPFKKTEPINVLETVSGICDKLILEEKIFREIDKTKLLRTISEILNEIPSEQMKIPEDELFERIRGVLVLEIVSGTLNELTPKQIKNFDEAVKRRHLFK